MRHRNSGVKLSRTKSHRDAMFKNMVTSLFKYDRIQTTDVKAKELRRWADKVITLAKRGDLHARRQALAIIMEKDVVHKLFEEAAQRFGSTAGGYTRIVKIGRRPGDAAPVSMIELIAEKVESKKEKTEKPKKKAAAAKSVKKSEKAVSESAPAKMSPAAEEEPKTE